MIQCVSVWFCMWEGLLKLFLTHLPSAWPFKKTLLPLPLEFCRVTISTLFFGNSLLLVSCCDFQGSTGTSEEYLKMVMGGNKNVQLVRTKRPGEGKWGKDADLKPLFELWWSFSEPHHMDCWLIKRWNTQKGSNDPGATASHYGMSDVVDCTSL